MRLLLNNILTLNNANLLYPTNPPWHTSNCDLHFFHQDIFSETLHETLKKEIFVFA